MVGAARSGIAAAHFLVQKSARVTLSDQQSIVDRPEVQELAGMGVSIESGGHQPATFTDQDMIVLSPGVLPRIPELTAAREAGVYIIPEIELAWMFLKGRIIGITGSNGKTTTTALIGKLLNTAGYDVYVGGNIGTPLVSQVERSEYGSIHVVELSSFQLETIHRFRASVAVLLNLTPDHLDRHAGMQEYVEAKGMIFRNQEPRDFAVLNADDERVAGFAERTQAQVLWFSRQKAVEAGAWLETGDIIFKPPPGTPAASLEHSILGVEEIPIKGGHNVENVLAAVCAAAVLGAEGRAIRDGVRAFEGVEHRLEFVAMLRGVEFYNDSKATNVDATIKALEAFPGNLFVILGGKDKGSDYGPLRPLLAAKARAVLLIGDAADKIASQLGDALPIVRSKTLEYAVREAFRQARRGDVVLLAPACASFDQFENYEHRGRVFKELVHNLDKETPDPGGA